MLYQTVTFVLGVCVKARSDEGSKLLPFRRFPVGWLANICELPNLSRLEVTIMTGLEQRNFLNAL